MKFNLTAVEIYEKEFTRSKKDKEFYSIQEVNEYLDLIIEDYQEIEKLKERLSLLEEENTDLKLQLELLKGTDSHIEELTEEEGQSFEKSKSVVPLVESTVVNKNSTELEKRENDAEIIEVQNENNGFVNEGTTTKQLEPQENIQETSIGTIKESEEIVESLSLDDIAEIRELLQIEREALYKRNEE